MPARPQLKIRETREHPDVVLALNGQLDVGSAPGLQDRLRQLVTREASVRVDLSDVDFIDSIGMRVLIDAARRAREQGSQMVVGGKLTPQVDRLFKLMQADHLLIVGE